MATRIVHHTFPTAPTLINFTDAALAYLQRTNEAAISLAVIEAMGAEMAQIVRLTGDSELSDSELRYAYLIASGEDVGFDDLPASLWP